MEKEDLKVCFKISNLDDLKKHIENLQRLITEVDKEISHINSFEFGIQLNNMGAS